MTDEVDAKDVTELVSKYTDTDDPTVAILSNAYTESGGVSLEIQQQANDLLESGHKVKIVALDTPLDEPKGADIISLGDSDNFYLGKLNQLLFPFRLGTMYNATRALSNVDIVICHRYPLSALAAVLKFQYGIPFILWHYHVPDPSEMPSLPRTIWAYALGYFEEQSFLVKYADQVCSISESSREVLRSQSGIDSIVLSNKTEEYRFNGVEPEPDIIYKNYDITRDDRVSIFVGRISSTKNIHKLIRMFEDVQLNIDSTKLVIIGKPNAKDYLRDLKDIASQDVIFAGYISDKELVSFYSASDVFVTASPREGRNLPPLEAQRYETPVIGFDVPGIRDVVHHGHLAPKNDEAQFITHWSNALIQE